MFLKKKCSFYGALGLGVYSCTCVHSAPQASQNKCSTSGKLNQDLPHAQCHHGTETPLSVTCSPPSPPPPFSLSPSPFSLSPSPPLPPISPSLLHARAPPALLFDSLCPHLSCCLPVCRPSLSRPVKPIFGALPSGMRGSPFLDCTGRRCWANRAKVLRTAKVKAREKAKLRVKWPRGSCPMNKCMAEERHEATTRTTAAQYRKVG